MVIVLYIVLHVKSFFEDFLEDPPHPLMAPPAFHPMALLTFPIGIGGAVAHPLLQDPTGGADIDVAIAWLPWSHTSRIDVLAANVPLCA
jgi:hypothetical protein